MLRTADIVRYGDRKFWCEYYDNVCILHLACSVHVATHINLPNLVLIAVAHSVYRAMLRIAQL